MNLKKREIALLIVITFFVGLLGAYTGLKIFQPKVANEGVQVHLKVD